MSRRVVVIGLQVLLLAGCSSAGTGTEAPNPSTGSPVSLTILAAASLTDAGAELEAAYEAATEAVDLTLSFDSSSALRSQIEAGAAADAFLSADARNAQALVDADLTMGGATPFANNLLTIVLPSDNPAGVQSWADLSRPALRIVAAGEDVPIQQYADQAVANLAELDDAPDGYADSVAANIVSREDNVRGVLTRIELGEGDAAIVYVTDALSSEDVTTIDIPEDANVPATYVAVGLASTESTDAVAAFLEWLVGDGAQAILADHGFAAPPS